MSEKELTSSELVNKIIRFCRKKHVSVHRHYSGRCMFGRECIGFEGNHHDCDEVAVYIRKKTGYDYCRDNMGLGMIYYFPDINDPRPIKTNLNPKGDQQ
jgi:hypothetical protein